MDRYTEYGANAATTLDPRNQVEPTPYGTLAEITDRLRTSIAAAQDIARQVREQADALHGSQAEGTAADKPREVRPGLIGNIYDALDALGEAQNYLSYQVARNNSLV